MMESELLQSPWQFYSGIDSTLADQLDQYGFHMDAYVGGCEYSSSFNTTYDASDISSIPQSSAILWNNFVQDPMEDIFMELEGFEAIMSDEIDGICGFLEESEGSFLTEQLSIEKEQNAWSPSPSKNSSEVTMDLISSEQQPLALLEDSMDMDNHLSVLHLLKACGEALEKEQRLLADVILRCLSGKVSPMGEPLERLAFNLSSQDIEKQGDYLLQESYKNFEAAFKAFYQISPYGKFAHFAANSAILESMPDDVDGIHIVDFETGEGVQWPTVIEAIARKQKTLRLTSINWEDRDHHRDFASSPSQWRFEETRRQLCDYATTVGLKLKVEQMTIDELVGEIKKMKKRGGSKEFLAFNCIVGLPHMRRLKSRIFAKEFLGVAQELLAYTGSSITRTRGVITFGDGDACEKLKDCVGFSSFFDGYLMHYRALLESIESIFPKHLAEARMVVETLFVAPNVSSHAWLQKWEEMKSGYHIQSGIKLEGWEVSRAALMEASEMVRGENFFSVRIGGQKCNEIFLEWKGTPLVTVSSWRNHS